jgi:hypothetical protein
MKLIKLLLLCMMIAPAASWAENGQKPDTDTKPGPEAKHYDVLSLPAVPSALAPKSLIYSIKKFGNRFFATGIRGHILYSDNGGQTWQQAEVPVRSSILDIDFPTPELGWAVGHEGVILHSVDGGKTWVKQYDGVQYGKEGLAHYQALAAENPDNEKFAPLVEEMEFAITQGADKPLFRVAFPTATHGYALGAYGMVLETKDGGEHWVPIMENVQNDQFTTFSISLRCLIRASTSPVARRACCWWETSNRTLRGAWKPRPGRAVSLLSSILPMVDLSWAACAAICFARPMRAQHGRR